MENKYWVIDVPTWGVLYATGTEVQADEWSKHKANWEGGVIYKREATSLEMTENKFRQLSELLG